MARTTQTTQTTQTTTATTDEPMSLVKNPGRTRDWRLELDRKYDKPSRSVGDKRHERPARLQREADRLRDLAGYWGD